MFAKKIGKKIIDYRYCNIIFRMSDMSGKVITLTVTQVNMAFEFAYGLLSTILLANKAIEVFPKKESC